MNSAHDIYSEVNPAFCSYVLTSFTTSYLSVKPEGLDLPIIYLALPIALSGDLGTTFQGTNKNTGLLEWLERSPQIQIALSRRVNSSIDIVSEALRFGCFTGILTLDKNACVKLGKTVKKNIINTLSEEASQVAKRAERLGYWFASAGTTKTIFNTMGLTV